MIMINLQHFKLINYTDEEIKSSSTAAKISLTEDKNKPKKVKKNDDDHSINFFTYKHVGIIDYGYVTINQAKSIIIYLNNTSTLPITFHQLKLI